uniref:Uncharacterized protein n=1 Tax=viral metagenome TaxID=1070528 RepID=A0A6H2A2L5_9ZZZZ
MQLGLKYVDIFKKSLQIDMETLGGAFQCDSVKGVRDYDRPLPRGRACYCEFSVIPIPVSEYNLD